MATLFERFPAKALVRLNARARSKVHFQIAFNSKRFITLSAFERLLARVYARVIFQITLRRKFFIARFTDTSSCSALTKISIAWNCQTDRIIHFFLFSSSLAFFSLYSRG